MDLAHAGARLSTTDTSGSGTSPVVATTRGYVTRSPWRTTVGSTVLLTAMAGWMTSTAASASAATAGPTGGMPVTWTAAVTSSAGAVRVQAKSRMAPGSRVPSRTWAQPVAGARPA